MSRGIPLRSDYDGDDLRGKHFPRITRQDFADLLSCRKPRPVEGLIFKHILILSFS